MSKKLDDELAQAAGLGSNDSGDTGRTSAPPVATPATRAPQKKPKTSMGLLITLLVMVGALVALFMVGFKEASIYAISVDQLLAQQDKLVGRKLRIEGELVPGTLVKRDKPCEYRFTVHGKETKETVNVRYPQCIVPDTFQDRPEGGTQVTVEGTLRAANDFEATLIMAKCTSKYDPSTHKARAAEGLPMN